MNNITELKTKDGIVKDPRQYYVIQVVVRDEHLTRTVDAITDAVGFGPHYWPSMYS